jgi:hypothetical protein
MTATKKDAPKDPKETKGGSCSTDQKGSKGGCGCG